MSDTEEATTAALAPARALGGMVFRTAQVLCVACLGSLAAAAGLCVLAMLAAIGLTIGLAVLLYIACSHIIGD